MTVFCAMYKLSMENFNDIHQLISYLCQYETLMSAIPSNYTQKPNTPYCY